MSPFTAIFRWIMLFCLLGSSMAYAQQGNTDEGTPPARLYLPNEYNAHSQNFAIAQDWRGMIYVGNFAGVLEYDGLSWRTIPTTNITKVSALHTAKNGTIYVGANGEFGYLEPDSIGTLRFVSLSQRVTTPFGEVLSVFETKDGIYFIARNSVFRWNGNKLTRWTTVRNIMSAFQVNQTIYFFQQTSGLGAFRNGRLRRISQRQQAVPTLYDVLAMLPLKGGKILLVTSNQGLFQLKENTIRVFASSANDYLANKQATSGTVLQDHTIAVGTLRGGIVLLTSEGKTKQTIRGGYGLNAQLINAMFPDREGNLWLALNNGIAQLEVPSPLTLFHESTQLTGEIMDIRRVKNVGYLATINGLFRIADGPLLPVPGLTTSCFSLAEVGGDLFVATSKGVYQVSKDRVRPVTQQYALRVASSPTNPKRLYVGTETGFGILTVGPQLTYREVPGIKGQIFGVQEDASGDVWLETLMDGLYRFTPGTNQITHYTKEQGLPTLLYNRVASTSKGLLVCNEKGIYRFMPEQNRFVTYNPFGTREGEAADWKEDLFEDKQGNIWTVEGDKKRIKLYQKKGAGYTAITTPFLPISTSPINVIYLDQAYGLVWFGGRDGVVRYDAQVRKAYALPYQVLIRRIQTVGEKTLFNGAALPNAPADTVDVPQQVLAHDANDISFEFAAANYAVTKALSFQYILENYDETWSDWTTASRKEYTNLPAGIYRFRVKARNIYNMPSRQAVYVFRVLPPWYGRWWVIALFAIAGGALLYWLIRWRLNALVREKQALETLIQERTEEVVNQKVELEKQSEELAIQNDQLEKIDLIVQSINAEIDFSSLFQTILTKFSVIRNMDSASFLIYDKASSAFKFKALRSNRDLDYVEAVQLTQEQAENRYLADTVEVHEDIYLKNDVRYELLNSPIDDLVPPKSLITIVIEAEGRIEGFITLENTTRSEAFDARDINMIVNLKEHLIAAFIKTRLLENLENTLADLNNAQGELIRQERLASVGQLTKGIVDRILNPLNYVNNFSQSSDGMIDDVAVILEKHKAALPADTLDDLLDELGVLKSNSAKIQEHSNSTTRILKDMQKLLKEKSRDFLETDLNTFLESKTRSSFQELKPEYKELPVKLLFNLENKPIRVKLLPHEYGQVVQNIVSNACYTLQDKGRQVKDFSPEISVTTRLADEHQVVITFRDNGKGIPQREIDKIFSPFFTTKPTSKGTGLGLFMSKDIIEIHKGKIEINAQEGEFTEIIMTLPILVG